MKWLITTLGFMIGSMLFSSVIYAQPTIKDKTVPKYDLNKDPVLYTVGYAHLDTQWRWDYPETVNDYIKATLDDNFKLFEKYKEYVFSFTGARRYRMMKEYYPEKYKDLKKYIAQGRWNVSGSSVDECDANIPSPESLIRQVLYGNNYFRSEFGKESVDFMLPDCFGFQAHLPSVLAHCGLKGFSTQKLVWGSAVGIPFNIGNWKGPDEKGIVAALNATDYGGNIEIRLDTVKKWVDRVMDNGKKYGVFADFRYYGTGDVGGAPEESSVKNGINSMNNPDRKIHVYLCSSDQLFRDLTDEQKSRLPEYSGDLLLTQHSAGSLTSEAYMKRWNRKNELLAQAAEPLAVAADWLGGLNYPKNQLNGAWWLVLGSQMHDILPGTCIPKAYEYAWNDEVLAMNQFSDVLESSAGAIIRAMDTRTKGQAVVVYNPLAIPREDIAEAEVTFPEGTPDHIAVMNPDGKEVPSQLLNKTKTTLKILFLASVPSFGLACYDVQPAKKQSDLKTTLSTGQNFLENEFYKVAINPGGDVTGIIDKKLNKELLSAPLRLAFLKEHPEFWPAWNMDWNDRKNPPSGFVEGPATITLIESGPVRATFKIERNARNSVFVQYLRLSAGEAGKRIEFYNRIDWQSKGVSLEAVFPLTAANSSATYNLGLGTIERANNNEKKYEVPSREWFDLTDKSGSFGVSVLEDCKFGSDKPDDKTLRLTLLYTPVANAYIDQSTQDWGSHEMIYGLYSHKGDWRTGKSEWQGRCLNQPLKTFQVPSHPGFEGKAFSFLKINNPEVDVRAIKKSENGDFIIIRLQELFGTEVKNVEVTLPAKIISGLEVDGQERKIGDAVITGGKLVADFQKFGIRSFALKLEPPADNETTPVSFPVKFPEYNMNVLSTDNNKKNSTLEYCIPAELFPETLVVNGISFEMGSKQPGKNNVLTCKGQKIQLPKTGNINRLYILAAAIRDTTGLFRAGESKKNLHIQGYTGKIGQFDKRTWDKYERIKGLEKGFIKRDDVAWFATHVHKDSLNIPYQYGYVFKYSMDVGPDAEFLQLPENEGIMIFAITLAENYYDQSHPAQSLYDDFSNRTGFNLLPGKHYATEDLVPLANMNYTRKKNLGDLPVKITMKDYADLHMPNGVTFKYFYSGIEKTNKPLPEQGMTVAPLNDGMFDLLPSDSLKDVWFEQGEGRLVMDLQKQMEFDSLHLFVNSDPKRGPLSFSIWGSDKEQMPPVTGDPKSSGWKFIVYSPQQDVWGKGKGVYVITPLKYKSLPCRYLLWVSEESGHGPYLFREIDVFEKQK